MLKKQFECCRKFGLKETPPEEMVAVAMDSLGEMPIYGSRVQAAENGNVSWFFHCGEYSASEDFYSAVHTMHLDEILPLVIPYLYLPPKTKFIIDAQGYEDVWIDKT